MSAAAGTLGLILGGVLVTAVGWRWIFLVNIPVGAVVVAAALRLLPADAADFRPGAAISGAAISGAAISGAAISGAAVGPDGSRKRGGFDVGGAISVTAGTSLLAYAVVQTGSHGWGSARTVVLLAVAAALIGCFLLHEQFVASSPLMPLALWRNRSVSGANVVSALVASALFAVFYSTTLYMQQVLHYSALRTGLAYVPFGLSILVAAGVAPALVALAGIRWTTIAGALVALAGFGLLIRIPADGHLLTDIIGPTVAVGLGAGLMIVPTSIAAMSGVAADRHGVASALLNVSRQLGGALGLAVISTVVASSTVRSAAAGHSTAVALTTGFRTGFLVSAVAGRGERCHSRRAATRRRSRPARQPHRAAGRLAGRRETGHLPWGVVAPWGGRGRSSRRCPVFLMLVIVTKRFGGWRRDRSMCLSSAAA